ncbi:hypothetical protein [Siphonobacter sp. SORGH_AS_0500]|uniref:hypothetical protein n=1 Tax=Siphonobacter sp. SORGH_AS_0500 TaxID=1864824 RepID=UPI00285B995C|nr:hypothetical protein [Siphonobacter sp. SORGH_AS_0500]MDR6197206.1 hypothetical protein [Siphonobacter sp. SORGH_AS_0500]
MTFSQVITGDAKGQSSILFQGGNFGFNLIEQSFDFNYNGFKNYRLGAWLNTSRQKFNKQLWLDTSNIISDLNKKMHYGRMVWGINARAKAANGIATIFNNGNIVPDAKIGGIIGWSFLDNLTDSASVKIIEYEYLIKRYRILTQNTFANYRKIIIDKAEDLASKDVLLKDYKDSLKSEINTILSKTENIKPSQWSIGFSSASSDIPSWVKDDSAKIEALNKYYELLAFETEKLYQSDYINKIEPVIKLLDNALDAVSKYRKYWKERKTIFFRFGLTGLSFKYAVLPIDSQKIDNSILDKTFTGFYMDLGCNIHIGGKGIFGTTIGIERKSSFNELTSINYSLAEASVKDTLHRIISTKQDITAYTGTFERYTQWNFNIDYLHFFKADDTFTIAPSIYIRHKIPVKAITSVTSTDLGVSTYFFKDGRPFVGGFYLQINDIADNGRYIRPKQNPISIGERWTFGIVSKVNVATLLGY